jgi:diguanylate cyclase (GGDEF)-like protein/PAS domain S-box-containing protein
MSTLGTSIGLLTCSAVLVHLSSGLIEMHFHFFVVIGIVALYQDWEPFLLGILYVVLEHGVGGAIVPGAVYDHPEAIRHPWSWAAVHGGFILAMSGTGIAAWRLNEQLIEQVSARQDAFADAQRIAGLGSWELDLRTMTRRWSDQLYEITGMPRDLPIEQPALLERIHPDDRDAFMAMNTAAIANEPARGMDCRWTMPNGQLRWMHIEVHAQSIDDDGNVVSIAGTVQNITDRMAVDVSLRETLSLLHATLDATADGILVVDLDGEVTTMSRHFIDMWRIPLRLQHPGVKARDLADAVLDELCDPDVFLDRARSLHHNLDVESHDIIEFVDGRVFERYSTPQRVGGTIVGRVWTCRDVTEHKRLQDELAHQAFHDPLTGLANQALFRALVEHAVARLARSQTATTAVLFIDLDNFKTVNDSLGHTVGDELLVAVSERLSRCVRPVDTTARLGGDEFAVLVEEMVGDEASVIAQRIIEELRRPFEISGKDLYASASIGIAFGQPSLDGDQLLRNADLAMYTAKRRGRGRYEVYEPDMHEAAVARLELEADLRHAIVRDQLIVHYQPVLDVQSGAVRGAEALVRWQHPTRGLVPPDMFISLAEESDLINDIGDHVLAVACSQMAAWQEITGDESLWISVNLSPRQLLDERIDQRVVDALVASRLAAGALVLEITEGAMVHDTDLAVERLRALKAIGVQLAMDDFGTGYSSLSHLHRFPIDIVKIDRSFVEQLRHEPQETSLASAILSLASALRLTTIAEGVQDDAQLEDLRRLGCDLAQGFHLARPDDAAAVTAAFLLPTPAHR